MKNLKLLLFIGMSLFVVTSCEEEAPEVVKNSDPGTFSVSVSDIETASAVLKWTAANDPDGDKISYTVKLDGNTMESSLEALSYSLSGLTAETKYEGTIVAEDGNGGTAKATFSFTTSSPENAVPESFTVTVDTVTDTSAELSWTAAVDPDGDKVTYRVILGDDEVASELSATTHTFSDLTAETEYSGKIMAEDGNGGVSEVVFSFTTESTPNSAPGEFTITVSNISDTTADVSWTEAIDPDGDKVTYKVFLEGQEVASELGVTSFSLTDLIAETNYNGTVVAEDGNEGVSGFDFKFITEAASVKEEDPTITITYGGATSTTLTIDSWTDIGVDGYVIVMNTSNQFSALTDGTLPEASTTYEGYDEQVVYAGTAVSGFTVSLLEGSTDYFFKVIPYTGIYVYSDAQTASSEQASSCAVTSTTDSEVCFDYSSTYRTITSNQLPDHPTGSFPNADVTATDITRQLTPNPELASSATYIYDETGQPTPSNPNFYQFGMAVNGVEFHPMGLKPWTNPNTSEENWAWQAAVVDENQTHLDAYGGHVTSKGVYHYHGDVVGLADEDGSRHSVLYGYAADGFPIYYKYGYTDKDDNSSTIKELKSSYRLKSGSRTGTGTAGEDYPDGDYDGTYIQDYEYVSGLGDLDECNGRYGVTPEYPDGIYYYVITSDFPKVPNCFMGTPDEDWIIGNK